MGDRDIGGFFERQSGRVRHRGIFRSVTRKAKRARSTSRDFSISSWTRSAPGEFSLRAIVEWRSCSRSTLSLSARARSRSFAARFFSPGHRYSIERSNQVDFKRLSPLGSSFSSAASALSSERDLFAKKSSLSAFMRFEEKGESRLAPLSSYAVQSVIDLTQRFCKTQYSRR